MKILAPLFRWFSSILQWFDAWTNGGVTDQSPRQDYRVEWLRCIPFFAVHLMCFGIIWVGWSPIAVAVAISMYLVRMFGITGIYHRYFSHRAYKTNRFWQFIFGVLGSSAVQRGPLWWAAHHRHHHRHSDKESDVHSPHEHDLLWSHMLWITSKQNFPTQLHEVKDLAKFPELRMLDRYDTLVPILLGVVMFYFGVALNYFWPSLGTSGMQMLIWGFFISTVALFHGTCTINSLSHLFGSRRYSTNDQSRNNFWLALVTLGEGWHNNHHHYPAAARQGFFWWEVDITFYVLKTLSFFGIIWDLKPVPEHIRRPDPAGRGRGRQAVRDQETKEEMVGV